MLLSYKGGKLLCYLTLLYISRLIEVHRRLHWCEYVWLAGTPFVKLRRKGSKQEDNCLRDTFICLTCLELQKIFKNMGDFSTKRWISGFSFEKRNIHADVNLIRVVCCMWRQIFGKQCFQSLGSHRSIPSHGKKTAKRTKTTNEQMTPSANNENTIKLITRVQN